jgi:hypothetical protein
LALWRWKPYTLHRFRPRSAPTSQLGWMGLANMELPSTHHCSLAYRDSWLLFSSVFRKLDFSEALSSCLAGRNFCWSNSKHRLHKNIHI